MAILLKNKAVKPKRDNVNFYVFFFPEEKKSFIHRGYVGRTIIK